MLAFEVVFFNYIISKNIYIVYDSQREKTFLKYFGLMPSSVIHYRIYRIYVQGVSYKVFQCGQLVELPNLCFPNT